ncbi:hypothetical protein HDU88_009042, partial [Geranomyces variabilis]
LRSVSRSLRRQCLNDDLFGHALLNSRGPYNFACKHDLAVKAPALVVFNNYNPNEGYQRQWMQPSTYDPVRETVTFLPVAVEIGACNSCAKNARAGACLPEHARNGIKAGTAVPLIYHQRKYHRGSAGARFEGWYPTGQEYFYAPLGEEDTANTYNVASFTASISWILQGICSGYVEARGLRPRLLRRLAEKLDKADATPRKLFEDPGLSIYGKWAGQKQLYYGDMKNAPRKMVRTAEARTADTLLREDTVANAMAAPENAATVADLEWWLFERYFKPHGLSFDGKTVPPVDRIAAAPDLMDMSVAPTTAFEALFKAVFKPLMKHLDCPGPLFACSRFLKMIGSLDAKAVWMFHRNEELFKTITLEATCPESHPKALKYSRFIWTALRTPGFVLAYANACVTKRHRSRSSASECRASTAWVDVILFGLRNASEPAALLTALLRNEMIANRFDACWSRMLYFGIMPIAEAMACKNFRGQDWEDLALQAARMQSFSRSSEGGKVRSHLWSEETSSRYLWEIISLGKLDLPTCGAEVLAEVVIAARDDIFYELIKRGCAYAPVRNRYSSEGNREISILHYAIGNPQFLEPLLDVPEVRRSGWDTAVDALLPGGRYAISANHPPSEVFRIFEVLMSRVEPDIIKSYTLKKIAKWLGKQSESFRAAQLATLHARVGTVKLRELASEWKKNLQHDWDLDPAANVMKEILGEILSFEELLQIVTTVGRPFEKLFELAGNDSARLQKVTIAFLSSYRETLQLPDTVMIESFEQVASTVVAKFTWSKLEGKDLSIRQATGNLLKLDARLLTKLVIDHGRAASLRGIQSAFRKPNGRAVIREIFKGVGDWIGEHTRDECSAAQSHLIENLAPFLGKCRPAYLCRMAKSKGMNDLLNSWAPERLLFLWSPSLEALATTCVAWRLNGVVRTNKKYIGVGHIRAAIRGIETRLESGNVNTLRREEDALIEFLSAIRTLFWKLFTSLGTHMEKISRIAFQKGLPRLAQAWGTKDIAQYLKGRGITICKDDNPASKSFGLLVLEEDEWCDHSAPAKLDDYGGWAAVIHLLEVKPSSMAPPYQYDSYNRLLARRRRYQDDPENRLARCLPLLAISILQLQSPEKLHDFVSIVIPALHRYISSLPETSSMRVEPLHPTMTMLLDVAWQVWLEELSTMYGDGCTQPAFTLSTPRKFREAWVLPASRAEPEQILQWADAPPRDRRPEPVSQHVSSVIAAPRQARGAPPIPRAKTVPSTKPKFVRNFGKSSAASGSVAASSTAALAGPKLVFDFGAASAASNLMAASTTASSASPSAAPDSVTASAAAASAGPKFVFGTASAASNLVAASTTVSSASPSAAPDSVTASAAAPPATPKVVFDFGTASAASGSVASSATASSASPKFVFDFGGSPTASSVPPPSASSKAAFSFGASSFATSDTSEPASQSGFIFRAALPASEAARTTRPDDGRRPRVIRRR